MSEEEKEERKWIRDHAGKSEVTQTAGCCNHPDQEGTLILLYFLFLLTLLCLLLLRKMAITVIRTAPDPASYTALDEYQSQTPESLTDIEVLHYSSDVEISFTPSTASPFATSSGKAYVTSK